MYRRHLCGHEDDDNSKQYDDKDEFKYNNKDDVNFKKSSQKATVLSR
jgi:hypothetical protein